MPAAYERMRDKFAKGAKKDSPGYNAAQSKAAKIYNSKHPDSPMGSGDEYEKDKKGDKHFGGKRAAPFKRKSRKPHHSGSYK